MEAARSSPALSPDVPAHLVSDASKLTQKGRAHQIHSIALALHQVSWSCFPPALRGFLSLWSGLRLKTSDPAVLYTSFTHKVAAMNVSCGMISVYLNMQSLFG